MKVEELGALEASKKRVRELQNQSFSQKTAFIIMVKERNRDNLLVPFGSYEHFKRHLTYCKTGR